MNHSVKIGGLVALALMAIATNSARADTWTTLDAPGAFQTYAQGASGNDVVGYYGGDTFGNPHGFIYNGSTWTTLDAPGALYTEAYGIDGNNIVGFYADASDTNHGFLYNG